MPATMRKQSADLYDVVVIGGGAAGLSGALTLARACRSVLVIDSGSPRNAPAASVHGLLAHEGIPPSELLARGRFEVRSYGARLISGCVDAVRREGDGFAVALADNGMVKARRLLVATGVVDELPKISGLRARWGKDVIHCPYCHGWEVSGRAIGVLADGPRSMHQALLLRQWSDDITFFSHTTGPPAGTDATRLAALGITVVGGEVQSLEIVEDRLAGLRLYDGTVVSRDVLAVAPRTALRAGFLETIGLRPADHPSGGGEYIPSDATGQTAEAGVWVAGNVTEPAAQVAAAAAAGAVAAVGINADLVADEAGRAVAAHRARLSSRKSVRA